jgi:hypothetical protein
LGFHTATAFLCPCRPSRTHLRAPRWPSRPAAPLTPAAIAVGCQLSFRIEGSCSSAHSSPPAYRPSFLASRSGCLLPPRAPDGPAGPRRRCPAAANVRARDQGATSHPWPCHRRRKYVRHRAASVHRFHRRRPPTKLDRRRPTGPRRVLCSASASRERKRVRKEIRKCYRVLNAFFVTHRNSAHRTAGSFSVIGGPFCNCA